MTLVTFPSMQKLATYERNAPNYSHPNLIPFAAMYLEAFSPDECEAIVEVMSEEQPYRFHECNAITTEAVRNDETGLHPVFGPVVNFVHRLNKGLWDYDLDQVPTAWMQTYTKGMSYQLHPDTIPGQTRKLTAVLMLTDPIHYKGGDLVIHAHPQTFTAHRRQGTIVMFQSHLLHEVTEITHGRRQTINMGFYGPPFR